jgi:hypothetical protein
MTFLRTAKKMIVAGTLGAALLTGTSSFAATTTNANAAAGAPLNAAVLINGAANANISVNSPAGQAAAAAAEAAKSPEMQKAVTSVWATAWDAAWPFIKSMVSGFFGLFVTAWNSATAPAATNPPVDKAGVNASSTTTP